MLSLLKLEPKQKNSSNPFRIRTFLLLSYSFRIETINTFIHSHSSLENHTRFQTKMDKVYTRFQTKTDPTRWGGTYLYGIAFLCPGHLNLVDEAPIFTNHALYKPPTTRKVCFFYTQTTVKMYRNRSYILSFVLENIHILH